MGPGDPMPPLVLASTSPYRQEVLGRLGLPFTTVAPRVDETRHPGETPESLVARLAEAKARAGGRGLGLANALVIGSDQVAVVDGEVLGKSGNHQRAVAQLAQCAGKRVTFLTGLCLLDTRTGECAGVVEPYHVHFRPLTLAEIEAYLRREQPYDAAGSFKSEGLGIALFERLEGDDPNALIGLPLIRLTTLLARAGVAVLA